MNFEINYDEAYEDNGLIAEGIYEVIVAKCEERETKAGTVRIGLQLTVRNDVDQRCKNKVIFENVWKAKATGEYNMRQINTIGKALKIANGKKYNGLNELLKDFEGKTAKVTIKHEEYNGNTNARVKNWDNSKFSTCNHVWKVKEDDFVAADTMQEDDLPF